jgi:hypothetical protein
LRGSRPAGRKWSSVEVIRYRDRIKTVEVQGAEVIKEIPVLVPMDSPLLAGGFRVFHDAAASGHMPDDPAGAARAAAPVEAPTLASVVGENYAQCRAQAEQLLALQAILKGTTQ